MFNSRPVEASKIKKHFEKIGSDYDWITNKRPFQYYLKRRKGYLKEFCEMAKGDDVIIDLGAGTSGYSEALLNCSRLINIDLSFNALNANKALNNKVSSINANAFNIPLKDNSVDKILLIGLLHHAPLSLPQLLQEVTRVLKKGGAIYIDEPNGYNIMWFVFMKLCEIDKIGARPLFPNSIKKVAKNNHLSIDKELYWGFVIPFPNRKFAVDIFDKIGSLIEKTPFSCLCTRYLLILKK